MTTRQRISAHLCILDSGNTILCAFYSAPSEIVMSWKKSIWLTLNEEKNRSVNLKKICSLGDLLVGRSCYWSIIDVSN